MVDPRETSARKTFTYGDLREWPEDERWEILDGEPFAMTPGPDVDHQRVSRNLSTLIHRFLEGKTCELFVAPFDVLLPTADEDDDEVVNVLQPDIMVVCDPEKVTRRGIRGAPDFVVEILSPSTASRDQIRKRRIYERHGVREYWVIDPSNRMVTVYRRRPKGSGFRPGDLLDVDGLRLEVEVLPGLTIDFAKVLPPITKVVRPSPRSL